MKLLHFMNIKINVQFHQMDFQEHMVWEIMMMKNVVGLSLNMYR